MSSFFIKLIFLYFNCSTQNVQFRFHTVKDFVYKFVHLPQTEACLFECTIKKLSFLEIFQFFNLLDNKLK